MARESWVKIRKTVDPAARGLEQRNQRVIAIFFNAFQNYPEKMVYK
jgi:hypothetical protein